MHYQRWRATGDPGQPGRIDRHKSAGYFNRGWQEPGQPVLGAIKKGEHRSPLTEFRPGQHASPETEFRPGEEHVDWAGDAAGYTALHYWIRRMAGPARDGACAHCGHRGERFTLQWANISFEYRRDVTDWMILCQSCHQRYDRENGWGRAVEIFGPRYGEGRRVS